MKWYTLSVFISSTHDLKVQMCILCKFPILLFCVFPTTLNVLSLYGQLADNQLADTPTRRNNMDVSAHAEM